MRATITAKTVFGGFEATCTVTVQELVDVDADYVDLGLSSGTLWATCNVGASNPEDYGDYFAWGETSTKTYFGGWAVYKHCDGAIETINKYSTSNENLELMDDAAYLNWGKNWRMPTYNEWNELRTSCTWTWTTQNGINGYLVSSQSNGNSIFLPAAGYCSPSLKSTGEYGMYWTSTLSSRNYGYNMKFTSGSVTMSYMSRYMGYSVRPVRRTN